MNVACVGFVLYWVSLAAVNSQSSPLPSSTVATTVSSTPTPDPSSATLIPMSGSGSALQPVIETPPMIYGNLTCEPYYIGGQCESILQIYPTIVTNFSRGGQPAARYVAENIIGVLFMFDDTSDACIQRAIPLLCRYSFPTCDPAYDIPVYQPICRRDCEIIRDLICPEPWQQMLRVLSVLDLGGVVDTPDCGPLEYANAGTPPMCISTLDGGAVPLPLRTGDVCYSGYGRGYSGNISVTESGLECQVWESNYPHQHLLTYGNYPEIEGGHNYCRNPGERGERPWCFTTDRSKRWEYCGVPQCDLGPTCEIYNGSICRTNGSIGMDQIYTNTSMATKDEYEAAMMRLQFVFETYHEECRVLLNQFLCVANFPSCDLSSTSPRPHQPCRSYCEQVRSVCQEDLQDLESFNSVVNFDPVTIPDCSQLPQANGGDAPECWLPIIFPDLTSHGNLSCYNISDKGETYRGKVNLTVTGKVCQRWDAQTPHIHPLTPTFRRYLERHNYCRNPEGRGERPWCYTTDPNTRWEYCNISSCIEPTLTISTSEDSSSLVYIGAAVVVPLLVIILVTVSVIVIAVVFRAQRKQTRELPQELDAERYAIGPVRVLNLQHRDSKTGVNPLYALNPLPLMEPIEYDGVKLPEFSRQKIIYIRDLGQGHFGLVVQAEAQYIIPGEDQTTVAIKVLKEGASAQVKKEFFREAALMQAFDHPNILKLLGVCIEEEPLCMIFEFMELGDLNNFLRQNAPKWENSPGLKHSGAQRLVQPGLPSQQLVNLAVDIASGLEYLATNHYVHRDMATRNCLVNSNLHVKISDFGLSQDVYSTDYFRLGDSELLPIRWMPPESIMYAKFTTQSDVWSFGIVLWEIFSFGVQPYYSLSNEEVVQHVRDGNVMNCPESCPQEIYDLMLDCWAMEPDNRPTAGELHVGLRRWNPDLSASLQLQQQPQKKTDYQNMATIREYAMQTSTTTEGGSFIPEQSDSSSMSSYKPSRLHYSSESSEAALLVHHEGKQASPQRADAVDQPPAPQVTPNEYEDTV